MRHPNIGAIYEAGCTPDGQHYFAMELVRGVPIDEFCDRHRLGLRERLELFLKVCDGVQRALGREPTDFSEFARKAAASGVWDVAALDKTTAA